MTTKEVEVLLKTSVATGLSTAIAEEKLNTNGKNSLAKAKSLTWLTVLARQLINPLVILLLLVSGMSLFIGEQNDAIVIGIAVALNIIFGFMQEWQTERTAQKLLEYQTKYGLVLRNKHPIRINTELIVPGDIVILTEGAQVPADVRIVEATNLQLNEAALTGESIPISKHGEKLPVSTLMADRLNMAYAGTYVSRGSGIGITVSTGNTTELGKIASMVTATEQAQTPLQQQISQFSWILGSILGGLAAILCIIGFLQGFQLHQVLTLAIALSVAALPEELLISITVILVISMRRMLKKHALVRNLLAAETLGGVAVVCADKTGTLSEGKLTLMNCIGDQSQLLTFGILNNNAILATDAAHKQSIVGDPLEAALFRAAVQAGLDPETIRTTYPRQAELPFSSDTKLMATTQLFNGHPLTIVKGAPEAIRLLCTEHQTDLWEQAEKHAQQGHRVIAMATAATAIDFKKPLPSLFKPTGLLIFHDPLRPKAQQIINEMGTAGIKVVMLTGDHQKTATTIASELGIDARAGHVITGNELTSMDDTELDKRIDATNVFARVAPYDKIRIVRAWQRQGRITAMTGDGINDAPALKAANIGVALGSGSDIAHSIAGIVLLDDNLATISAAIREGRIVFDNIRKVLTYLLADCFSQVVLLAGSLMAQLPLPLLPTQILWIHIVTDGLPNMALAAESGEPGIMREKPRQPTEPIVNTEMLTLIFLIGIITDIILFAAYALLLHYNFPIDHVRTIMFHSLAIASLTYVFAARTLRRSCLSVNPLSNPWLLAAVATSLLMQVSCSFITPLAHLMHLTELSATEWSIIFAIAPIKLILIEITKAEFRRHRWKKKAEDLQN